MRKRGSGPASAKHSGVVDRLSATYGHLWGRKTSPAAASAGVGSDVRDLFATAQVRAAMLEDISLVASLDLVAGALGEASVRLTADKFLVTAAASSFHQPEDGNLLLSSETPEKGLAQDGLPGAWPMHLAGYRQLQEAGASLLGQPAATMALLEAGRMPDAALLAGAAGLGQFMLIDAESGSALQLDGNRVLFVKRVGVLVFANTLQQAISDLHLVNRLSEISVWQTRGGAY